jgi:hypothetical protein
MNDEDFWTVWKQRHSTIAVQFLTAFGRLSGLLKKYGLDGRLG